MSGRHVRWLARCPVNELGGCDAVVLLGGGMGAHKRCGRAEMTSSADRVWEAARQAKFCYWLRDMCLGWAADVV